MTLKTRYNLLHLFFTGLPTAVSMDLLPSFYNTAVYQIPKLELLLELHVLELFLFPH